MPRLIPTTAQAQEQQHQAAGHEQTKEWAIFDDEGKVVEFARPLPLNPPRASGVERREERKAEQLRDRKQGKEYSEVSGKKCSQRIQISNVRISKESYLDTLQCSLLKGFDRPGARPLHVVAMAIGHLFEEGGDIKRRIEGERLFDFPGHPRLTA